MRPIHEYNGVEYYLVRVDKEDIPEVWNTVREGVHNAMLHSDASMSGDEFFDELMSGNVVLWLFVTNQMEVVGHMITQIIRYSRKSFVRVLTMECKGGEKGMLGMNLWSKFVPEVEEYAARNNCQHLEAYTRAGMARALKKHGWENQHHIVTKEISYGI